MSRDNLGAPVLFPWAQRIEEFVREQASLHERRQRELVTETYSYEPDLRLRDYDLTDQGGCASPASPVITGIRVEILHGEVVVDRKSSFQGHAARVSSAAEVE